MNMLELKKENTVLSFKHFFKIVNDNFTSTLTSVVYIKIDLDSTNILNKTDKSTLTKLMKNRRGNTRYGFLIFVNGFFIKWNFIKKIFCEVLLKDYSLLAYLIRRSNAILLDLSFNKLKAFNFDWIDFCLHDCSLQTIDLRGNKIEKVVYNGDQIAVPILIRPWFYSNIFGQKSIVLARGRSGKLNYARSASMFLVAETKFSSMLK